MKTLNYQILSFFIILVFSMQVLISCKNSSGIKTTNKKPAESDMIDLNRYLLQKDKERILNYIERKNLNMTESPTGLWYQILNEGEGDKFTDNKKVVFEYNCSLLDGTVCYSSDKLGPKEIILGRTGIETGLIEGLKMLKPGGEAIFILPPYLAYGLVGDGKMISSRSVIVYKLKILE
jgi:FKBP-type peptidyl-prolyl cis-trans isomerase FkpA